MIYSFRTAIFRFLALGTVAFLVSLNCAALAAEIDTPIDRVKPIFKKAQELVKSYYPRASFCLTTTDLHFELNVKKQTSFYSSHRIVAVPQQDGILGDLALKAGKYKEALLSERNEGFYTILVLAPYSKKFDSYLLAQLSFPPGLDPEFKEEFKSIINSFNAGEGTDVIGLAPDRTESSWPGADATGGSASDNPDTGNLNKTGSDTSITSLSPSAPSRSLESYSGLRATMEKLPVGEKTEHPITTLDTTIDDDLPLELPASRATSATPVPKEVFKISVTSNVDIYEEAAKKFKKAKDEVVYEKANSAMKTGEYKLACKLYEMLCLRKPKDPRYFYGAGEAYRGVGDPYSAFSNFVIAWHLGQGPIFEKIGELMVPELKARLDDTFKLTYGFGSRDPEAILNAGTRCWKAGLEKQSWQLFLYALKNEPAIYARIAAYDMGAICEHRGNLKAAHLYYQWAVKDSRRLEALAQTSPHLQATIRKSFELLPMLYLERASLDVESQLLRGSASTWGGWIQATVHPKHWSSEVCPLCAISRTETDYHAGESHP